MKDARNMYRVQTVPPKLGSFDMRVPLAEAWRGKRQGDLNEASGLTDGEFVHKSGFIGGAWSQESVIKMAELSIKEFEDKQKA
mmetsp:Transcript_100945/g.139286  ORF Transcript_100945/g.139286 Transcript_100945/m.139286 type:complete len:83 (+) Transcript_100945:924-1172(+)